MSNLKQVKTSDYEGVLAATNKYVEGLKTGNITILSSAFHKDATIFGYLSSSPSSSSSSSSSSSPLFGGPISELYEFVKKAGGAKEIKTRIDVLAITPTSAVVRVDLEKDAAGNSYHDYLSLLKSPLLSSQNNNNNNEWFIFAKVFHKWD